MPSPPWAALPSDLLLAIAQEADDPSRQVCDCPRPSAGQAALTAAAAAARRLALMRTCSRWRALLLEAPRAWPMTVLYFPELECEFWEHGYDTAYVQWDAARYGDAAGAPLPNDPSPYEVRQAIRRHLKQDQDAGMALILQAAGMDPRTVRVRLAGYRTQVRRGTDCLQVALAARVHRPSASHHAACLPRSAWCCVLCCSCCQPVLRSLSWQRTCSCLAPCCSSCSASAGCTRCASFATVHKLRRCHTWRHWRGN